LVTDPSLATIPVLRIGESAQFRAGIGDQDIANTDVVWTVRGGSVNGSVDANGLYTAPATAPNPASVFIEARRLSVPAQTATYKLFVVPRITVSPASATLPFGGQVQFTAQTEGLPVGVEPGVIWVVENESFSPALVGTITAEGLYTAPSASGPGVSPRVTIYARAKYRVQDEDGFWYIAANAGRASVTLIE
jgi:hypothetical protein